MAGLESLAKASPTNMDTSISSNNNDMLYYESRRGENWNYQEVKILTEWIHISATFLDILSEACESYRKTLRANTIVNLVFSTVASTISVSTFNMSETNNPGAALALKIAFTCMTMILTIAAGYIKVYQIQEKLENSLRLKNEWALFGSKISSEMQLPLMLRTNGIALVSKMKDIYLQLVQSDLGIRKDIIKRMAARSGLTMDDLTLSEIFERIANDELSRITDIGHVTVIHNNDETDIKPVASPVAQTVVEVPTNPMANVLKDIMSIGKNNSIRAPIRERGRIASFINKPASSMKSRATYTMRRGSTSSTNTSGDSDNGNSGQLTVVPRKLSTVSSEASLEVEGDEEQNNTEAASGEHVEQPIDTNVDITPQAQPAKSTGSWNIFNILSSA